MEEIPDLFKDVKIKADGSVREVGPTGEPIDVMVVSTTAGSFWFEVYYEFADNGK